MRAVTSTTARQGQYQEGEKGPRGGNFIPAAIPGPAPHWTSSITATLQLGRKEGGFVLPWGRKGELGNQGRDAGGLWRAQGRPCTLTFSSLLLGVEEGA